MKRNHSFLLILTVICFASCNKLDIEKDAPKCIQKEIKKFEKGVDCDNGVKVEQYNFQGKIVYVFDPGSCGADLTAEVKDSDCNDLGFLGGISGNTMINGESFSTASFIKITWER